MFQFCLVEFTTGLSALHTKEQKHLLSFLPSAKERAMSNRSGVSLHLVHLIQISPFYCVVEIAKFLPRAEGTLNAFWNVAKV